MHILILVKTDITLTYKSSKYFKFKKKMKKFRTLKEQYIVAQTSLYVSF